MTFALLAVGVGSAGAATVRVEEASGEVNRATLFFQAARGEQNQVTVIPLAAGLQAVDSGAPLTAGPGCSGGGAPGSPVSCAIHPPTFGEYTYCGRDCFTVKPGTGWLDFVAVDLGDGDNVYDGSALTGTYDESYAQKVTSGAGEDRITTGAGNDEVEPGPGRDEVHTGFGYDRIFATPQSDGPDRYDGGKEGGDMVSYAARTAPVLVNEAGGGAPGEGDVYESIEFVAGGSGDDTMTGGAGTLYTLSGGPGNDTLIGGEGEDNLFGNAGEDVLRGMGGSDHLDGGDGNDRLEGGAGNDIFIEKEQATEGDNLSLEGTTEVPSTGDDVAEGGPGNDLMWLGGDNDQAEGGEGDDTIYGEAGDDSLNGGVGNDVVAGEAGADLLLGGAGDDQILSGRLNEYSFALGSKAMDGWSDRVECGEGDDTTDANRWDQVTECEHWRPTKVVEHGKLRRLPSGAALLPITLPGPGTLRVTGPSIRPTSRTFEPKAAEASLAFAVRLRPRGSILRHLHRRGHARVEVHISFAPLGGLKRSEDLRVRLNRRR